ncbi:MAG: hypothetical protein L0Y58_17910 [Verrucomicrobia subdivision 3 bacterium]|nr:hypothetical protein [Limisphaerales bacterium]
MRSITLTTPTRPSAPWEGRADLSPPARLLELITGYWITQLIYVAPNCVWRTCFEQGPARATSWPAKRGRNRRRSIA